MQNTSILFDLIHSSDVDECVNSPCGENVPCINVEGSYSCECLDGWTGKNCTEGKEPLDCFKNCLMNFDKYRNKTCFFLI